MHKLITTTRGSDDLSIVSDRDPVRKQRELTSNKNQKSKYLVRNTRTDIFGFPEQQDRATNCLGDKLTLTRNSDNSVLNKTDVNQQWQNQNYWFPMVCTTLHAWYGTTEDNIQADFK